MKKIVSFIFFILSIDFVFCAGDDYWFKAQTKKAELVGITATSELIEAQYDGKYIYPPVNVVDGNFENTWCEAEQNGPGIGQAITIELKAPVSFDEIQVVNGFVYKDYYKKNNRVKSLQITQVAKKHFQQKTYELKDNVEGWQSIKFEQLQTAQIITFTIIDIYKGNKYDDTCLDDIRFLYKGKVIPFVGVENIAKIQEENSKDMLSSSSKDFEATFVSLFKQSKDPKDGNKYLVLKAADNSILVIKGHDTKNKKFIISDIYNSKIFPFTSIAQVKNELEKKQIYVYFDDIIKIEIEKLKPKYLLVEPSNYFTVWPEKYTLGNYRIVKETNIDYIKTVTSSIIKLDGSNIYINGVQYSILDASEIWFQMEEP